MWRKNLGLMTNNRWCTIYWVGHNNIFPFFYTENASSILIHIFLIHSWCRKPRKTQKITFASWMLDVLDFLCWLWLQECRKQEFRSFVMNASMTFFEINCNLLGFQDSPLMAGMTIPIQKTCPERSDYRRSIKYRVGCLL